MNSSNRKKKNSNSALAPSSCLLARTYCASTLLSSRKQLAVAAAAAPSLSRSAFLLKSSALLKLFTLKARIYRCRLSNVLRHSLSLVRELLAFACLLACCLLSIDRSHGLALDRTICFAEPRRRHSLQKLKHYTLSLVAATCPASAVIRFAIFFLKESFQRRTERVKQR
jgi:hypothetical protein